MKFETINGIRVITPEADMWLCNETDKVISDKVYLGINADENEWRDITDIEKARLEQLWSEETPETDEATKTDDADEKAAAFDILMGVSE